MDALATAKCCQTELKDLLELEALHGEPTFPEAHAFTVRKLVLCRRAEIWAKRYGTGEKLTVENEHIGNERGGGKGRTRQPGEKARSQSEPPKCTTCGKAHHGTCWATDKCAWPNGWREQTPVPHKTLMQRLKAQKCIWCGGDYLSVKCGQNHFRKDTASGKQEGKGGSKPARKDHSPHVNTVARQIIQRHLVSHHSLNGDKNRGSLRIRRVHKGVEILDKSPLKASAYWRLSSRVKQHCSHSSA